MNWKLHSTLLIGIFILFGLSVMATEFFFSQTSTQVFGAILLVAVITGIISVFFEDNWTSSVWYTLVVYLLSLFYVADKLFTNLFGISVDFGYLVMIPVALLVLTLEIRSRANSSDLGLALTEAPEPVEAPEAEQELNKNIITNDINYFKDLQESEEEEAKALATVPEEKFYPVEAVIGDNKVQTIDDERKVITNIQINNQQAEADIDESDVREIVDEHVSEVSDDIEDLGEEIDDLKGDIQELKDGSVFIGSTNGSKFHNPSCMIAVRIPEEKRRLFKKSEEALEAGYSPCGVCVPPANK